MFDYVESLLSHAGALMPVVYILLYVLTALLVFIPTPLVSALGGTLLGFWPAVFYGAIGLGLGAVVALGLSRYFGRPLILKLIGETTWQQWEYLLGIRSIWLWTLVFGVFNVDFAVLIAGLSPLPLRQLWLSVMLARMPWLILAAWLGKGFFDGEYFWLQALLILVGILLGSMLLRRMLKHYLTRDIK
ncbi:MAG: VTT domain-containing protein [Deinococcales bacterium]